MLKRNPVALLQDAMATLRDGTSEEEEALLAGMESQRREWAEALAPKLNKPSVRKLIGSTGGLNPTEMPPQYDELLALFE